jgi:hypothetical protein
MPFPQQIQNILLFQVVDMVDDLLKIIRREEKRLIIKNKQAGTS